MCIRPWLTGAAVGPAKRHVRTVPTPSMADARHHRPNLISAWLCATRNNLRAPVLESRSVGLCALTMMLEVAGWWAPPTASSVRIPGGAELQKWGTAASRGESLLLSSFTIRARAEPILDIPTGSALQVARHVLTPADALPRPSRAMSLE